MFLHWHSQKKNWEKVCIGWRVYVPSREHMPKLTHRCEGQTFCHQSSKGYQCSVALCNSPPVKFLQTHWSLPQRLWEHMYMHGLYGAYRFRVYKVGTCLRVFNFPSMVLLPFTDLIQTREQEDAPSSSFPNRLHDPDSLWHNKPWFWRETIDSGCPKQTKLVLCELFPVMSFVVKRAKGINPLLFVTHFSEDVTCGFSTDHFL